MHKSVRTRALQCPNSGICDAPQQITYMGLCHAQQTKIRHNCCNPDPAKYRGPQKKPTLFCPVLSFPLQRAHVTPRHRAMLFVSSHYGHARGTPCFSPARPIRLGLPMMSVHLRLPTPRSAPPPRHIAATGHPLFSCHSLPCQTAQHRPRTPPLPPPTPVEAAPFVGGRSPCF